MIKRLTRKQLDVAKYDACIENSLQSKVFAFSWYLDIVADNWDVYVLNDYEAVMPIPWRKKYFIKYVYQPLWTLQLGVFSKEYIDENEFLVELFDDFKYVELRANIQNSFSMFQKNRKEKQLQLLSVNDDELSIFANYRSDRKKDLKRAIKADLTEKWNDDANHLIQLLKDNVGKRLHKITGKDYDNIAKLIAVLIDKKMGEILSVYDAKNNLVASGFFIKYNKEVTILFSATDLKNRKNGANTFLIDRAINKYKNGIKTFNFGGSSIQSIAKYFKSFGATTHTYESLHYNNLPFFLKWFKK